MVALVSNRERMKINLLISVKNKKKLHDNEEMNKLYFLFRSSERNEILLIIGFHVQLDHNFLVNFVKKMKSWHSNFQTKFSHDLLKLLG